MIQCNILEVIMKEQRRVKRKTPTFIGVSLLVDTGAPKDTQEIERFFL
jgi:hypothetical protein